MNYNINDNNDFEELSSDIRSNREEEFFLNLRIKMDKKLLDELSEFFGGEKSGEYPLALKKLVGGKLPFDVYMANSSGEAHPLSINMVLATDTGNKHNADITEALDNMTLSIYGINNPDWFTVTSIRKVPSAVGTANNRVLRAEIVFFYNHSVEADSMGPVLLDRIFALPNIFDETKIINQRIAHWDEYLKINESFAEEAQVLLDYSGYRKSGTMSQLVFNTRTDKLLPAHNGSDIQLVLGVEKEYGNPVYKGPVIGTISRYNASACELTVDLDFDFAELWQRGDATIPHSAKLFVTKWGDLVQLRRLRYGLNTFARGQAENPRLDVFIFDSSKATLPPADREILHREDLLQTNLNEEQHRAVEGVINSPDLYLIQGPPGTGKTTVIAEICYQTAIRGQKTLIASQTNLAVDNALGKLIHHHKIRALRKGNEQSVQEEGKLFTENNIIKTWLDKTADDCSKLLADKRSITESVNRAENSLDLVVEQYSVIKSAASGYASAILQKSSLDKRVKSKSSYIESFVQCFKEFTDDVKSDAFLKLTDKTFDTDEAFAECVKNYYASRIILDERLAGFEKKARLVKLSIKKLEACTEILRSTLNKYAHKGKYKLLDESAFEVRALDFDEWNAQSEAVNKEVARLCRKKPFGILISLGLSKKWPAMAADAINRYYEFKGYSRKTLVMLNRYIDKIKEDTTADLVYERLNTMAEGYVADWNTQLSELIDKLAETESIIKESKADMQNARDIISKFHDALPYQPRTESIESIGKMSDIRRYYRSLWEPKCADDIKIAGFMESWTKRLANKTEQDNSDLRQLYIDNANVIGITCSQSGSREFTSQYPTFDVAIIDEVSKATPPELILSVLKARKIVLVGDHKQLPPMVGADTYEEVAKKLDIPQDKIQHMKSSLFEELFVNAPESLKTMLSTQYRMHSNIMDTINQFYIEENGYGLKCGLPEPDKMRAHGCHGKAISADDHALWVDVPLFEENAEERSKVNYSYSNKAEIDCIRDILISINSNLTANGYHGKKKIGIISFYSNQVRLMESAFNNEEFLAKVNKLSLRIGSVDRFQGIECPVVICSFVRNNSAGEIGFAKDPRRVNVALSRAQELSIIVGSSELFCYANNDKDASEIYKTISQYIYSHGGERSAWDFK